MANTITPTLSATPTGGTTVARTASVTFTINDTDQRYQSGIQTVGTSEEAVNLGDLSGVTLGYAWFKNLDATNFVQIKTATSGTLMVKLKPGEAASFRFGSGITAPYIIADTASCRVEYVIFAD